MSKPVDSQTRGTLLFALSTFGSLTYDLSFFYKLVSEGIMQESPFIEFIMQRGIEQGMEQGILQANIKNILSVLTKRFPLEDVQPVAKALESIKDLDHLSEIHLSAIDTPSVETFLQELEASEE